MPARPRPAAAVPLVLCLAAGWAAGCGGRPSADYSGVGLADVSGTVTLDGDPLAGAVVRFHEPGTGRYAFAETDGAGRYTLQFNSEAAGVLPGPKEVHISTAATGPEVTGGGGPERVPARYNRDTELTAEVKADATHTFDFALTSGGETADPPAAPEGGEDDPGGDV